MLKFNYFRDKKLRGREPNDCEIKLIKIKCPRSARGTLLYFDRTVRARTLLYIDLVLFRFIVHTNRIDADYTATCVFLLVISSSALVCASRAHLRHRVRAERSTQTHRRRRRRRARGQLIKFNC